MGIEFTIVEFTFTHCISYTVYITSVIFHIYNEYIDYLFMTSRLYKSLWNVINC